MTAQPPSRRDDNPIIRLAEERAERSRALVAWAIVTALLWMAGGLLFHGTALADLPVFRRILPGRLITLHGGERFLVGGFVLVFVALTAFCALPAAALSVTRERERESFDPLLLAQLSRWAIVSGKLWEATLTPTFACLALWPLTFVSFPLGGNESESPILHPFLHMVVYLGLIPVPFAAIGLCASCWCRRSPTALAWSYAAWLLLCVGTLVPIVSPRITAALPASWAPYVLAMNPVAGLIDALRPEAVFIGTIPPIRVEALTFSGYLLLTALCYALAVLGMRHAESRAH